MRSYQGFQRYAMAHGALDNPALLQEMETVYNKHKGSRYATICALFKTQCLLKFEREYLKKINYGRK